MKPRDEDNLISLAFGELSEEEEAMLLASLQDDSKDAATLAGYRQLKADLLLLNDIPEPQISTERIRGAILGRGLKQKSAARWGWLLGPALAGLFGIGLMLNRTTPPVAQKASTGHDKTVAEIVFSPIGGSGAGPASVSDLDNPDISTFSFGPSDEASTTTRTERHAHPSRLGSRHRVSHEMSDLDIVTQGFTLGQLGVPEGSGQSAASHPVAAKSGDQKILMVQGGEDSATGTQQATEVDSNWNGVVSG